MPTNHTPNFNLSQWEKTDKVLMDDFNADNAKIDAALFNRRAGELITKVTVEEETQKLDVDISRLDWNRYLAVALLIDTAEDSGIVGTLNDGKVEWAIYLHPGSNSTSSTALFQADLVANMTVIIFSFYDGNNTPKAFHLALHKTSSGRFSMGGGVGRRPLNQCSTLTLRRLPSSETFVPGDSVAIWGLK